MNELIDRRDVNTWLKHVNLLYVALFFLISFNSLGQILQPIVLDSLKKDAAVEVTNWKFKNGDDTSNSQLKLDDNNWIDLTKLTEEEVKNKFDFSSVIWFRAKISIDSNLTGIPLFIIMAHQGASQLFIDGVFIRSYGNPDVNSDNEILLNPRRIPFSFSFKQKGEHVICVRYSNHRSHLHDLLFNRPDLGFNLFIGLNNSEFTDSLSTQGIYSTGFLVIFGFLIALSVLHLLIYFFYKEQHSNLTYSLFTFCFGSFILFYEFSTHSTTPTLQIASNYLTWRLAVLSFYMLLQLVYSIVYTETPKKLKRYTNIAALVILFILFFVPGINSGVLYGLIVFSISTACFVTGTLISTAIRKKMEGIKMVGRGFLTFIYIAGIYYLVFNLFGVSFKPDSFLGICIFCFLAIGVLSIPFTMSMYLAFSFAKTNRSLKLKLKEVEDLSAITLEQERERKRLIESQKEDLEIQVKLRTAEVVAQKEELSDKNKEIIDSITYAKRLQQAILPPFDLISSFIPENFILYTPKDIIAGDFYWFYQTDELIYIAAADSTGHGVPGAMVSIVCSNSLDKAVKEFNLKMPGPILDKTTDLVLETFSKSGEEIKDGMDISLLCINKTKKKAYWSGANNPLWYISGGEMREVKADKQPVGKSDHRKKFTTHEKDVSANDIFYLFTDGYPDQFGGPNGKKFKYGKLNQLLLDISSKKMDEQKAVLLTTFANWKGNLEQVDDVCILGIRF